MKVFKCDCCGKYYDTNPAPLFGRERLVLIGSVLSHDQTEIKDLCEGCDQALQDWWHTKKWEVKE